VVRAGPVSGSMPYEPVIAMRSVRRHLPAIRGCFERARRGDSGSFETELKIDAAGRVTSASIARLSDRVVKSCTLAVLERIEFNEAKAGGTIRFPLIVERAR